MITQSTGYGNCGDKIFFNNEANAYSTMDRRHNFRIIDMFYNESTGVLTLTQNPDVLKHAYIGDNPVGSNQARSHKDAIEYILDFNKFQKWGFDRFDKDKHYVIVNKYADSKKKYAYLSFSLNANRWYETFLKEGDEFYDKDTDIKYRLIDGKLKNITDVELVSKQEMYDGFGHEIHLIVNPRTNSTVTLKEADKEHAGLMPATHFDKVENIEKTYAASLTIEDYRSSMRQRRLSLINKNGEEISSVYVDSNQWLDNVSLEKSGNSRTMKFSISGPNGPESSIVVDLEQVLDIQTEETDTIKLNYSEENVLSANVKIQDSVENKLNVTSTGLGAYIRWKDKGYVNFDYGIKEEYNQNIHQDYIYFSTDTNLIFLNGIPFGLDLKSLDLELVLKVELGEIPGTLLITNSNGIEYVLSLPIATPETNGLLSARDKLKLDSIPNLIVAEIHERIEGTDYGLEIITNNTITGLVTTDFLVLSRATTEHDGLLSAIDKKKLDSMGLVVTELQEMEAENEQYPTRIRYTVADKNDSETPDIIRYMDMINATPSYAGLQSKEDKLKEDRIIDYVTERSEYKHLNNGLYNEFTHYNPGNDTTRTTRLILRNATLEEHGLQSSDDKLKEDRITDYFNDNNFVQNNGELELISYLYNPNTDVILDVHRNVPVATLEHDGVMSYEDKTYIDSLPSVLEDLKTNLENALNAHISDKNNPHETTAELVGFAQNILEELFVYDIIIKSRSDHSIVLGVQYATFNTLNVNECNLTLRSATTSYAGLLSVENYNVLKELKHTVNDTTCVLSKYGTPLNEWKIGLCSSGNIIKSYDSLFELLNHDSTDHVGLVVKDLIIKGNVTLQGNSFITDAERIEISDNTLLLNSGETGAGVTEGFAGVDVDRGTLPTYRFIFDEIDDRFKVGKEGDLWPVLLRENEVDLLDNGVFVWDNTTKRAKTVDIQTRIDGYIPLAGTQENKPITGTLELYNYRDSEYYEYRSFITPGFDGYPQAVFGTMLPFVNLKSYSGIEISGKTTTDYNVHIGAKVELNGGTSYYTRYEGLSVNPILTTLLNVLKVLIKGTNETVIGKYDSLYTAGISDDERCKIWNEKNDGHESGLDADTLDGKHASEFALTTNLGSYLPLSGGELTGILKITNGLSVPGNHTFNTAILARQSGGSKAIVCSSINAVIGFGVTSLNNNTGYIWVGNETSLLHVFIMSPSEIRALVTLKDINGNAYALAKNIPTIPSLSGGASATSGLYVSGVTVSGHTVTVTKNNLPNIPSMTNVAYLNKAQTWTAYQDFTAGAGNSGSDMRYKENVSKMSNVLDKINDINIIQYTWNKEGERQRDTFGVSADELLEDELLSKIVHERPDEEKTKFVEYDRLGVLAIKAIQELKQEIDELKRYIQVLENK